MQDSNHVDARQLCSWQLYIRHDEPILRYQHATKKVDVSMIPCVCFFLQLTISMKLSSEADAMN